MKPSLSWKYFYTQTNSITTLSGVSLKLSELIALINVPTLLTPSCEHACHPLFSRGHSSLTRCKKQATLLKGCPLTLWLPPHTYASRKRHTTSDAHKALSTHPLSGTQQGSHVLDSGGAIRLHQSVIGSIYQRHPCAYLCLCAQCATHGDITVFKQQMQRFTAATVIWCAHLWRTCLASSRHLFSPLPNALSGMRSFVFSELRQISGSPYSQHSPNAKYLWGLFPLLGNTTDPWQPWPFLALCVLFTVTRQ